MTGIRFLLLGIGMLVMLREPHGSPAPFSPEVQHTSWKAYDPKIPDTVTLRFENDSAAVLTSTGVPVLQSTYKLKNDIIIFHDYGGMNACRDLTGSYHAAFGNGVLWNLLNGSIVLWLLLRRSRRMQSRRASAAATIG